MLLGDARAIVLHTHHGPALLLNGKFDMHACANATGIFDAILYQIHEHPTEVLRITGDEQLGQFPC